MVEGTTIGSHSRACSEGLGEVRHHLVDMFLRQLFPAGLLGDIQLTSRLVFRLELLIVVLCQHGAPDVMLQCIKSGEFQ